ncbi:ATP-binding protein [Streptomyces sp. NPDC006307]|uniref:sensor histidine kinase n=1 Tax=Streptomyces sp. NPDC006307 TaxID=3156748 RepID=UPI0033A8D686
MRLSLLRPVRAPLVWGPAAAAVLATAAYTLGATRRPRTDNAALAAEAARARGAVDRAREEADRAREETDRAREEADRARAEAEAAREEARRSERNRAAAVAACANAAGRMQALATSMLADLREMEHRHTDEDVLADLLHLDHRTAQAGRLADSLAVLTGARSGRRWAKPIVMESILRGAMGRIGGYQRVRLHSTTDAAIAGHAAEGVMHALAELLDNAVTFSPPTAEVHVYVEEVPSGLVVSVEDSGLVMSEVQLRRAERAVSTDHTDLSGLSGTRLGLAVVGRLARKHGLTVSFRPSARGGTGVVVTVPQELITRVRVQDGKDVRDVKHVQDPAPRNTAQAAPEPAAPELGESGLPKRRRGRTLAAARPAAAAPAAKAATEPAAPRPADATRFHSFRQAVRTTTEGTPE